MPQPAGSLVVETMGSFLVARCYIRTPDDFRGLVSFLFLIVLAILPFALAEAILNRPVLLSVFSIVPLDTHVASFAESRWGLRRVQGVFEHPRAKAVRQHDHT